MWPIQLGFFRFIVCIFLSSLTFFNTSYSLPRSVQLNFSIFSQHHISHVPRYRGCYVRTFVFAK
jgi:hypothetical protein